MRWFVPDQEQAGAIPGRSCIDHIVTLRLLINFAMHKKEKLYIVYVDFSKAYDGEKKAKRVVKLINFLSRNRDAPFLVKKKVFDAVFLTSILYSCESWFETPVDKLQIMFNSALKSLLGVRKTTPNILCLIECGYPPLKFYIKEQQRRYFCKIFVRSHNVDLDDPLIFALHLHTSARTDLVSQELAQAARRANSVCTKDKDCDVNKGQECRRHYEGCPKGQCFCKPNTYQPRHSDECKPIILGYDQCLKESDCPDSMSCQNGKCVCLSGYMTPDGIQCLLRHHRLLGQECSTFDHTCVQLGIASRRYTHLGVTCGTSGSCECTGGKKHVGYSCMKWNINEQGCGDSYQCQGGALCVRGTCRCPSGYSVYNSQCVKRGDNAPETRRSTSGASDLKNVGLAFLLFTCSILILTRSTNICYQNVFPCTSSLVRPGSRALTRCLYDYYDVHPSKPKIYVDVILYQHHNAPV
ncbi:hypothetical protein CAPTEDRAFT_192630 [Capitella teleta]|uniref:EB domain-containing protein n=1 Tax=Capitella teleta TaxID=283909 RepID=R7U0M3_CAPTE|nr:hypothetical protein CAPTEDRAFT_192630 [Capitella teleta]|eukprot:ELT96745.1 hypothetical protein CAPTEDRAFT_192630 [Capitella teleta]